jgi:hypothetical protein
MPVAVVVGNGLLLVHLAAPEAVAQAQETHLVRQTRQRQEAPI